MIRDINTKTNEFGDPTDPAIELLIRAVTRATFTFDYIIIAFKFFSLKLSLRGNSTDIEFRKYKQNCSKHEPNGKVVIQVMSD